MCYKSRRCISISRIQEGYFCHVEAHYYDEVNNRIGLQKFSNSAPKAEVLKSLRNDFDCVVPASIANGKWKFYQVLTIEQVRNLVSA